MLGTAFPDGTPLLALDSASQIPSQCLEAAVHLVADGNMSQMKMQGAEGQ